MVDSRYNTLLIVEGESCEKLFFELFVKLISEEKGILIVPFCNDIYELYHEIMDYKDTTTKDVLLTHSTLSENDRYVLKNTKFVNTYLIFDLDLQNNSEDKYIENLNKIRNMIKLFDDETGEYGKLFVNYPMMESYRHFYYSNPDTLKNKQVLAFRESLSKYKETVGKEGTAKNLNKYSLTMFSTIARAHLMQANYLINNSFKKPDKVCYQGLIDIRKIHEKQSDLIINKKYMLVLNTSVFLYCEFFPKFLVCKN